MAVPSRLWCWLACLPVMQRTLPSVLFHKRRIRLNMLQIWWGTHVTCASHALHAVSTRQF